MIYLRPHEITDCLTRRDGRVHLVSYVERVGMVAYFAAIEWYWYTPATSRNRLFDVYGTEWRDLRWIIAAFPSGRLPAAERLAKQLGLRLANGAPAIVGRPGGPVTMQMSAYPSRMAELINKGIDIEFFPGTMLLDGSENHSIRTIENDARSPVYQNRKRDERAMMQASEEINEILNHGTKLTPAEIADYIYGSGPFPNA